MATDVFLKIDGIKGEATDVNHKDEVEVLGWSWGVSEALISSGSGTTVGGTPKVGSFAVTKQVDRASPRLLEACLTAKHITSGLTEHDLGNPFPVRRYRWRSPTRGPRRI